MGTFCRYVEKFDRGRPFRRYCVRCPNNTAHLGDKELHCSFLEYRPTDNDKKPAIRIPAGMR